MMLDIPSRIGDLCRPPTYLSDTELNKALLWYLHGAEAEAYQISSDDQVSLIRELQSSRRDPRIVLRENYNMLDACVNRIYGPFGGSIKHPVLRLAWARACGDDKDSNCQNITTFRGNLFDHLLSEIGSQNYSGAEGFWNDCITEFVKLFQLPTESCVRISLLNAQFPFEHDYYKVYCVRRLLSERSRALNRAISVENVFPENDTASQNQDGQTVCNISVPFLSRDKGQLLGVDISGNLHASSFELTLELFEMKYKVDEGVWKVGLLIPPPSHPEAHRWRKEEFGARTIYGLTVGAAACNVARNPESSIISILCKQGAHDTPDVQTALAIYLRPTVWGRVRGHMFDIF